MSRFPMRHRATRWILALVLIACLLPAPQPIAADEIILVGVPLIRKFPAFDFCPFPLRMEFTASGSTAKIFVSANVYVFDNTQPPGEETVYTHQGIDDIVVVRDSVAFQHMVENVGSFASCYSQAPVDSIFNFDEISPSDASYYELFDSAANGWDLANGAYYDNTRSGPIAPSSGSASGTGCLGLGLPSGSPSLADTARTQVSIGGLIAGKRYVLTGWWSVDNGIPSNQVSLTIQMTGPDQTPLARRTWGAVKARYR
jgi:hypothetical protein